mgnify:FL=1
MIIFARNDAERQALREWAGSRIPNVGKDGFDPGAQCAAVIRNGALAAAVLFHDWQPGARTMQCSMAADTPLWASREVLRGLFAYVFITAGANKLWTAMPHTGERAIRFNVGIGMKREAVLRHHFGPKAHAVICSMMRDEWARSRWRA